MPINAMWGRSVGFVLSPNVEGGLSDHPADTGGRTNHGITQRLLTKVRRRIPHAGLPSKVDRLSYSQAAFILREEFWTPLGLSKVPWPWCLLVFDYSVNSGPTQATKDVQRTINALDLMPKLRIDGNLGPKTCHALRAIIDYQISRREGIPEYLSRRLKFMATRSNAKTFIWGWSRRVLRLQIEAFGHL